jgi:hypothetical protein
MFRSKTLVLACAWAALSVGGCSTIRAVVSPATGPETVTETRAVIDADGVFILAASALNTAEANGTVDRATAEPLRLQAYTALLALRAAVDARRHPDFTSFNAAIAAINNLTRNH